MKKIFLPIIIVFLSVAPFIIIKPIKNYYTHYKEIAKKYDCYPIESCKSDFNNDGKADIFSIINEPKANERYNYRLKIFVQQNGQKNEILNIKYVSIDNSFRTHVAVLEENDRKKLVIYDTENSQQFFVWNGKQLLPTSELTPTELEIWKAMSLEDDAGGFNRKVGIDLILIALFGIYYFVLLTAIIYLHFKKKSKLKLS